MPERLSPARRVNSLEELERPGDYFYNPTVDPNGKDRSLWFILPIADPEHPLDHDHSSPEAWKATQRNGRHRIASPSWTITENADGSVSAQPSIGCGEQPYYWHGYLDPGNVWREV